MPLFPIRGRIPVAENTKKAMRAGVRERREDQQLGANEQAKQLRPRQGVGRRGN